MNNETKENLSFALFIFFAAKALIQAVKLAFSLIGTGLVILFNEAKPVRLNPKIREQYNQYKHYKHTARRERYQKYTKQRTKNAQNHSEKDWKKPKHWPNR